MSTNLLSKKVIIVAILAVGAVAAVLVLLPIAQATAQERKMMWSGEGMPLPQINGSVSVANETSSFINENVKVEFVTAAETAQGQVADGKVVSGHLGVVQGYLVYMFFVADTGNQTGQTVIVDAGNGEVLHTSESQPLGSFGHSYGHGHGGWGGHWKGHGGGWGFWR